MKYFLLLTEIEDFPLSSSLLKLQHFPVGLYIFPDFSDVSLTFFQPASKFLTFSDCQTLSMTGKAYKGSILICLREAICQKLKKIRKSSKSDKILAEFPQGSILSPVLFLLCLNNLTRLLKEEHALFYLDDTLLNLLKC